MFFKDIKHAKIRVIASYMHQLWTATKRVTPQYDHPRIDQDPNVRKRLKLCYTYTPSIRISDAVQTRDYVNTLLIFACWLKGSKDDKHQKQVIVWI
jgi:hypothetical protein